MKLDDEMKKRIDDYFDSISPEDLYKELTEVYNLKDVEPVYGDASCSNLTKYICMPNYSILDVKEFDNHNDSLIKTTHDVNVENSEDSFILAA